MGLALDNIGPLLKVPVIGKCAVRPGAGARVVIDSRRVRPGDAFFAIRGEKHDGHAFITPELIRKTSYLLVSREWHALHRTPGTAVIAVEDTILAMLKLCEAYLSSLKTRVVAVTGSNGKTTTRAMIARVLKRKYRVFETLGNFNNRIGLPLSVFGIDQSHDIAVLEMGANHFNEIEELSNHVHPRFAVITNVGRGHLEFFKNRQGVLRAKTEILAGMERGGILIVNADDGLLRRFRPAKGIRRVTFGFSAGADCRGRDLAIGLFSGTSFTLPSGREVRLAVPGKGAALNAMAALCAGRLFKVPEREAIRALAETRGLHSRMEVRESRGACFILDNYNANPDSLSNVLDLIRSEKKPLRKIAVLGDMGELGKGGTRLHREAGRKVCGCGFRMLLTLGRLGIETVKGARSAGMKACFSFTDPAALLRAMQREVRRGDLVLIKGSHSMEMEALAETFLKGGK